MKELYFIASMLLLLIGLGSCSEDKGNYDYDWISEAGVSLGSVSNTFQVGDPLVLRPTVSFTKKGEEEAAVEDVFSEDEYEYFWIAKRYVKAQGRIVNDTIGRERNLNYIIALTPDEYMVEYQICNKSREIKWLSKFEIKVTLSAPEGWLLLEDKNGQAELSIYARLGDGSMHMVRNMLANSGIPASALAGPRQVFGTYQNQVGQGVWILTDHFTGYLNVKEGHKWNENQAIRRFLVESVEPDFTFNRMIGLMFYTVFGFSDDGLRVSRYPGMFYTGELLNDRFVLAPYACATGDEIQTKQILFFDKGNKKFKILDVSGNFTWADADTQFPQGYDLMLMQTVGDLGAQKICCLLKKDGGVHEVIASSSTQVEKQVNLISNSEHFLNAEQIVYHMFQRLPYYLSDNKLYVYQGEVLGDREVEFWRFPEEGEEVEEDATQVKTELEGRITYIKTQMFNDINMTEYMYRRGFMNYLVVATELPDGTGKVYFLTPEQENAYKLTISDVVTTDHKVVSIDYQRPEILKY